MSEKITKVLNYPDAIFKEDRLMTMVKEEEMFCPKCGKQDVWVHQESGEYDYEGKDHICVSCEHHFTIQTHEDIGYDELDFAVKELRK